MLKVIKDFSGNREEREKRLASNDRLVNITIRIGFIYFAIMTAGIFIIVLLKLKLK